MLDVIVNWGFVLYLCTDHEHVRISLLATYVCFFGLLLLILLSWLVCNVLLYLFWWNGLLWGEKL